MPSVNFMSTFRALAKRIRSACRHNLVTPDINAQFWMWDTFPNRGFCDCESRLIPGTLVPLRCVAMKSRQPEFPAPCQQLALYPA